MRARVAEAVEQHEADAGEMHDERLEPLCLWAQCEEVELGEAGESGEGLA